MKKILIPFFILLLFVSCSPSHNPEDLLESAVGEMNKLDGYRVNMETLLEADLLLATVHYQSKGKVHVEKDGESKKIMIETNDILNGEELPLQKSYYSKDEIGMFDYGSGKWVFEEHHDDFLINQMLSLYNPESNLNGILNSTGKKTLKIEGKKEMDGIPCIGVSVKMEADAAMDQMGGVLSKVGGLKGMSGILSGIGKEMLKSTETIYWIGEDDHLIHGFEITMEGKIGTFQSMAKLDHFGEKMKLN